MGAMDEDFAKETPTTSDRRGRDAPNAQPKESSWPVVRQTPKRETRKRHEAAPGRLFNHSGDRAWARAGRWVNKK